MAEDAKNSQYYLQVLENKVHRTYVLLLWIAQKLAADCWYIISVLPLSSQTRAYKLSSEVVVKGPIDEKLG